MGSSVVGASSGLSATDLITQPQWTLLGSTVATTAAASFSITSIPQTYRTLKIVCPQMTASATTYLLLTFNSNSGTVYNSYGFSEYTNGIAAGQSTGATSYKMNRYNPTSTIGFELFVENYSSATEYKLLRGDGTYQIGGDTHESLLGIFGSTTAITSLTFAMQSGTLTPNPVGAGAIGLGIFVYGGK